MEVQQYFAQVNKILFRARYAPATNFASQTQEVYTQLGLFGTGALFTDDALNDMNARGLGLRYKSIFLGELYFMENAVGAVDHVHRRYKLTARQAVQEFGENALPKKITDYAEDRPDEEFEFLHVACPNPDIKHGMRNYRGMPFSSCHISYEERALIREGGYHAQPYAVSRYVTASSEVYGRSPCIDVLPSIKMANAQKETLLRAGHLAVDPPMLLNDDGILAVFDRRPGADNFGMVDAQGRPLAMPLATGSNLKLGMEMIEETRKEINESLLITLFQVLVEADRQMTAYEVMQRAQEKGALLAPTAGRQQSELLGPIVQREIEILARAGQLPPMPKQLMDAGGEFEINYQSPLARAQKAELAIGLSNTIGILQPIAQVQPDVLDRFDFDTISKDLSLDVNGLPATWLHSDEAMQNIRDGRQQQQQMQQMVQAAPAMSAAAANVAKIQQAAGAGGGTLPGMQLPGAGPTGVPA
jgi:hypothetical protein